MKSKLSKELDKFERSLLRLFNKRFELLTGSNPSELIDNSLPQFKKRRTKLLSSIAYLTKSLKARRNKIKGLCNRSGSHR